MGLVFLFVDGLGIGKNDPACNPLAAAKTPEFRRLLGGPLVEGCPGPGSPAAIYPLDATLGVPGLPQSATGQTSLLTGLNAPALAGRHVNGLPTALLRDLIAGHGIYRRLIRLGKTVDFANAYTPGYMEYVAEGKWRHSASTVAALSAGLNLHMIADIAIGKSVYQDLTGAILREKGFEVPLLTPGEAGRALGRLSADFDLTVFEYFQTDIAGHSSDFDRAVAVIRAVDEAIAGICETLPDQSTLILTSDHGNIEDMTIHTHTVNPVPFLVYGPGTRRPNPPSTIMDVAPWILKYFEGESHS